MEFGSRHDAKKAMKLKWKEGISLKEAWKRVNKFGNCGETHTRERAREQHLAFGNECISCGEGFEPNPAWQRGSRKKPCLKKCEDGFLRSEKSNRCVSIQKAVKKETKGQISAFDFMNPKPVKQITKDPSDCVGDFEPNPMWYSGSRKSPCLKKCKDGLTRSLTSNRCVKLPKQLSTDPVLLEPLVARRQLMMPTVPSYKGKPCSFGNRAACTSCGK